MVNVYQRKFWAHSCLRYGVDIGCMWFKVGRWRRPKINRLYDALEDLRNWRHGWDGNVSNMIFISYSTNLSLNNLNQSANRDWQHGSIPLYEFRNAQLNSIERPATNKPENVCYLRNVAYFYCKIICTIFWCVNYERILSK